jgi:hypothetical protein
MIALEPDSRGGSHSLTSWQRKLQLLCRVLVPRFETGKGRLRFACARSQTTPLFRRRVCALLSDSLVVCGAVFGAAEEAGRSFFLAPARFPFFDR